VTAYLRLDPDTIEIRPGFTRDVRNIGHYGTGDLEVTMKTMDDFERAQSLLQDAYGGG
jgi:predicted transport protein